MKRTVFVLVLCVLLAGCAPSAPGETTLPTTQPVQTTVPTQTTAPELSFTLYLPNANADGFDTYTVITTEIIPEGVLEMLIVGGVLPRDAAILSFSMEDGRLNLDMNRAFGDKIRSTGTAGELMIIGSTVNTFLSAFEAETVYFTVEGQILESGHVIYDTPIGFVTPFASGV